MFGVQCFAMVNIFNPVMSYLVDAVSNRGASVTAAANLVRMIWTFALSLIGKRWRKPFFTKDFFVSLVLFIVFSFSKGREKGDKRERATKQKLMYIFLSTNFFLANPMTKAVGAGWVTFFFGMLNLVWALLVLLLKLKPGIRKFSGY